MQYSYSTCTVCGKRIHKDETQHMASWFDQTGYFCGYPEKNDRTKHIPEEGKMKYTEKEIRAAWNRTTKAIEKGSWPGLIKTVDILMAELKVPDLTDITSTEIAAAFRRWQARPHTETLLTGDWIINDIAEHR